MDFFERLKKDKWTAYRLSKQSGVPLTTVNDLVTRKTDPYKLTLQTSFKLASALQISLDELYREISEADLNSSYDVLRSDICHALKDRGDLDFLEEILGSKKIENLYAHRSYIHCYYLLGMVDYLCRIHDLPLSSDYDEIRQRKLHRMVYPSSMLLLKNLDEKSPELLELEKQAIPEFARFNIYEGNVRNVV